ncbi:MAG TPA: KGG domain-containing protein [Candidatus Obscuribacterales bacterium]
MESENKTKKCGFASMSLEKRREISSKGGKSAHDKGTLHKFTSGECSNGGAETSQDKDHMVKIGRKGGETSHNKGTLYRFTAEDCRKAWKRST